ncbi:MAG: hypothetical protein KKH98_12210 [Spirochaetes bacterium]|nr:hypothetical protein [Spirochaetota bacterium]
MKKIFILSILLLLVLISCDEEEQELTKGYYPDETHYEVIAFGRAPEHINNRVQARNMAKEAALIQAQLYIRKEFKLPEDSIQNSGIIKEVQFKGDHLCRLKYKIEVKALKKKADQ